MGRIAGQDGGRFVALTLWLCAAGILWLLLSPAAFRRRALTRRTELLRASVRSQWLRGVGLERWRDGLENDPTVIEREARKLGYGRPGERIYPLSPEDRRLAAKAGLRGQRRPGSAFGNILNAVAPVLMLIIIGTIAVLFFSDLKIDDRTGRDSGSPPSPGAD